MHDASVTPLRHCNRLHCSSLFRLSAHAWQFDCLSFPHRFPPIISALCVFHPHTPHQYTTPLPSIPCPPLPLTVFFIKDTVWVSVCFLESCGKFSLKDYHCSSSCCSGDISDVEVALCLREQDATSSTTTTLFSPHSSSSLIYSSIWSHPCHILRLRSFFFFWLIIKCALVAGLLKLLE